MAEITDKGGYRFVSVEGCTELGRGGHGIVYQINDNQVVKVFYDRTTLEMILTEYELGETAFNSGVRSSRFYEIVETEQGYGIVMGQAGAAPLGTYMHEHPEQMQEYVKRYVKMLREMHTTQVTNPRFEDYKEKYKRDIRKLDRFFKPKDISGLIEMVEAIPDCRTMVHGDCHPQNVLHSEDDELLFIDMADLGFGHSVFDVAGLGLLVSTAKESQKRAMQILGMSSDECQQMWNYFLREYYGTDDDETIARLNRTFFYFGRLRMATLLATTLLLPKPIQLCMVFLTRIQLLRHKEEVIRLFSAM